MKFDPHAKKLPAFQKGFSLSKQGYRFVKMHEDNLVKFLRYTCLF